MSTSGTNPPSPVKLAANSQRDTNGMSPEECVGRSLEQLSNAFTASSRRWELIVYPSLFAFILLALYGFYLIYSLTQDVSRVADNMETVTTRLVAVTAHMGVMNEHMGAISGDMGAMTREMTSISREVSSESKAMDEMVISMRGMNHSMTVMTGSMDQMRYHIAVMNTNVSRPMSFMNSFMPW